MGEGRRISVAVIVLFIRCCPNYGAANPLNQFLGIELMGRYRSTRAQTDPRMEPSPPGSETLTRDRLLSNVSLVSQHGSVSNDSPSARLRNPSESGTESGREVQNSPFRFVGTAAGDENEFVLRRRNAKPWKVRSPGGLSFGFFRVPPLGGGCRIRARDGLAPLSSFIAYLER
jgi:hypothetical protein